MIHLAMTSLVKNTACLHIFVTVNSPVVSTLLTSTQTGYSDSYKLILRSEPEAGMVAEGTNLPPVMLILALALPLPLLADGLGKQQVLAQGQCRKPRVNAWLPASDQPGCGSCSYLGMN